MPSSTRIMVAAAVINFVIDAIRKIVSHTHRLLLGATMSSTRKIGVQRENVSVRLEFR